MIGYVLGAATGYVLGTKAGRGRYEQLARTYRKVADSPVTRKAALAARERLAETLSTTPRLQAVDREETIYVPRDHRSATHREPGPRPGR